VREGTWVLLIRLIRLDELPGRAMVAFPTDDRAGGGPRLDGGGCDEMPSSEAMSVMREEMPLTEGARGTSYPGVVGVIGVIGVVGEVGEFGALWSAMIMPSHGCYGCFKCSQCIERVLIIQPLQYRFFVLFCFVDVDVDVDVVLKGNK
jgi:hypothetical protein